MKELKKSGISLKVTSKTDFREMREWKDGCPVMLLGNVGARLSGNLFSGNSFIRIGVSSIIDKCIIRACENFW